VVTHAVATTERHAIMPPERRISTSFTVASPMPNNKMNSDKIICGVWSDSQVQFTLLKRRPNSIIS